MIPTETLTARLKPTPTELTSPLPLDECLHRLHIGLIDHPKVMGKVEGAAAKLHVKRKRNDQTAEMQVALEPQGGGTVVRCVTRLPTAARLALLIWAAVLVVIFGKRMLETIPGLLERTFSWADVMDILIPFAILVCFAGYLHLRVTLDRKVLAAFVAEAVKGQVRVVPQRPTQRPLVE